LVVMSSLTSDVLKRSVGVIGLYVLIAIVNSLPSRLLIFWIEGQGLHFSGARTHPR
jgi:hypothetical protein